MSRLYRAGWVVPVATDPIRDGAVLVEGDRIAALGPADVVLAAAGPETGIVELPEAAILPGLVNAHTHLGLTGQEGRHPRGRGLEAWLASLVGALRDLDAAQVAAAARAGVERCWEAGTGLVGDIVSHPAAVDALREHPYLAARLFMEFLGVREEVAQRNLERALALARAFPADRGRLRSGLSPHAPYSVHPSMWRRAARAAAGEGFPMTIHVAEPAGERELLERGRGPLRAFLEGIGAWDPTWPAPGCSAAELLHREEVLGETTLLVHGVHLRETDMERLALEDTPLCLCPRSNLWLGLPPPPVEELWRAGVFLCLGTDSLASNEDLGVWGEMREVKRLAPRLPDALVLRMATAHGAMALGFAGEAGVLWPGGPARMLAVAGAGTAPDPVALVVRERVEGALRWLEPRPGTSG